MTLWLARSRQSPSGAILRLPTSSTEEAGTQIRYVQLAVAAGETLDTDPHTRRAVEWILQNQLQDGGLADITMLERAEIGTTARALRALASIDSPSANKARAAMARFLIAEQRPMELGGAWAGTADDFQVVTGATSLAVAALCAVGERGLAVREGLRYLIASQNADGGWSEVPGYESTLHNTFNCLRAILACRDLAQDAVESAVASAGAWFLRVSEASRNTTVLNSAYAVRLAALLPRVEPSLMRRLISRLADERGAALSSSCDVYSDCEAFGIALLELSHAMDDGTVGSELWPERWALPSHPPHFLRNEAHVYDVLYGLLRDRRWVHFVDWAVEIELLEAAVGAMLGLIAALGIIDDRLTAAGTFTRSDTQHVASAIGIGLALFAWGTLRLLATRSKTRLAVSMGLSTATAAAATFCLSGNFDAQSLPLVSLYLLVIDLVGYTADRTGVLARLLPA